MNSRGSHEYVRVCAQARTLTAMLTSSQPGSKTDTPRCSMYDRSGSVSLRVNQFTYAGTSAGIICAWRHETHVERASILPLFGPRLWTLIKSSSCTTHTHAGAPAKTSRGSRLVFPADGLDGRESDDRVEQRRRIDTRFICPAPYGTAAIGVSAPECGALARQHWGIGDSVSSRLFNCFPWS